MELDRLIPGSLYFKWREFLWLKEWKIHCFPTPRQEDNIIRMAKIMKVIREHFNKPIIVISGLRPIEYNKAIEGATHSAHRFGMACDFVIKGYNSDNGCDYVRRQLVEHLEELQVRMEDEPRSNWVHIDMKDPTENGRYFKP